MNFCRSRKKEENGIALGRDGKELCPASVLDVKTAKAFDQTALLTIKVPAGMAMRARVL